jgi:hypothetical protein
MSAGKGKDEKEEKRKRLDQLLSGEYALVHLNGKAAQVTLPEHLSINEAVTLKLSHQFRGSLELDDDKVVTNLLFSGNYFECVIPYHAIWGVTSEAGVNYLWPESTPAAVLENIMQNGKALDPNAPIPLRPAVEPAPSKQKSKTAASARSPAKKAKGSPAAGFLKRVK